MQRIDRALFSNRIFGTAESTAPAVIDDRLPTFSLFSPIQRKQLPAAFDGGRFALSGVTQLGAVAKSE